MFVDASCILFISSYTTGLKNVEYQVRTDTMAGPPHKKQKREEYKKAQQNFIDGSTKSIDLPKKKFYRQRAHANPFSDHNLT
jgi:hypothetical protein